MVSFKTSVIVLMLVVYMGAVFGDVELRQKRGAEEDAKRKSLLSN